MSSASDDAVFANVDRLVATAEQLLSAPRASSGAAEQTKIDKVLTPERVERMHSAYFDPATSSDERVMIRGVLEATGRPVPEPTAASAAPIIAAALSAGKFTAAEAPFFGQMVTQDFEMGTRVIERLPGHVAPRPAAPVAMSVAPPLSPSLLPSAAVADELAWVRYERDLFGDDLDSHASLEQRERDRRVAEERVREARGF